VALVLGVVGFVPMCGVPLSLAAIVVGMAAKDRIRKDAALTGTLPANLGILFGMAGAVLQAAICMGAR
jgi:hypothetical protein